MFLLHGMKQIFSLSLTLWVALPGFVIYLGYCVPTLLIHPFHDSTDHSIGRVGVLPNSLSQAPKRQMEIYDAKEQQITNRLRASIVMYPLQMTSSWDDAFTTDNPASVQQSFRGLCRTNLRLQILPGACQIHVVGDFFRRHGGALDNERS